MNVAQELSDRELYDYDVLIKLLGDRFDPASRVSASRSRFHGRTRRHQEDADTYADSITELCRLGYPQSSPELCKASATPRTSTDRWNKCSHYRKTTTGRRRCSPWWTDSSGTHRGRRNHLCLRSCNRCSPSSVAWDTRCDRLLAVPTPLDGHRVPRHRRVKDTAHHFDLVATNPRLSVSAAVRWDICRLAAPNRIHLYHLDRTVGVTGRMGHSDTTSDPHKESSELCRLVFAMHLQHSNV